MMACAKRFWMCCVYFREVCEMIHSQFGEPAQQFPYGNFCERVTELCVQHRPSFLAGNDSGKVLEIGAMGGKVCFELAKYFDDVTGVDFTARLIQVGHRYRPIRSLPVCLKILRKILWQ